MYKGNDLDVYLDCQTVSEYLIKEELDAEDIAEGLVPEEMWLKIGYSHHAVKRMNNDYGRQTEQTEVEDIILAKSHYLFSARDGEEFSFVNEQHTIVIPVVVRFIGGNIFLFIPTVIRKVIVVNGKEVERKSYARKGSKVL
ncbi:MULTISPECIES: hypothetical protein [unclassified Psychrobacillus]|uniref:hypothetical protein n=1 Tax=unclassified Psychrobacillus TaxID=2636677 RepID=UPI0030F57B6F